MYPTGGRTLAHAHPSLRLFDPARLLAAQRWRPSLSPQPNPAHSTPCDSECVAPILLTRPSRHCRAENRNAPRPSPDALLAADSASASLLSPGHRDTREEHSARRLVRGVGPCCSPSAAGAHESCHRRRGRDLGEGEAGRCGRVPCAGSARNANVSRVVDASGARRRSAWNLIGALFLAAPRSLAPQRILRTRRHTHSARAACNAHETNARSETPRRARQPAKRDESPCETPAGPARTRFGAHASARVSSVASVVR